MVFDTVLPQNIIISQGTVIRLSISKVFSNDYPSVYFYFIPCFILLALLVFCYVREVNRRMVLQEKSHETELDLKSLLEERDWLLKEINHRVKNNLQIMISLLNSQEFFLKNNEALSAVKNSQRRLHAISLAYQKIYEPLNPSEIDMHVYITELVDYLQDEYGLDKSIKCNLHVCQASLPITTAVPIGLIINEALSNSFNYAFPGRVGGKIEINFICKKKDGSYTLSISDDGIGLPENFLAEEIQSLGTSLIMGLSRQLHGELLIKNEHGVSISLDFTNLKSEDEYPA